MCSKTLKRIFLYLQVLTLVILSSIKVDASHIRAGNIFVELTAERHVYKFTFIGVRDVEGVEFGFGEFNFGDGVSIAPVADHTVIKKTPLGNNLERVEFTLKHRYDGSEQYIVSYLEEYRNHDILNMTASGTTAFYVETMFEMDPFIGPNNYPVFTILPVDFAAIGTWFIHSPGAFDEDGDSLAFRLVTPQQARDVEVNNYLALNHPSFYSNYATGSEEGTIPTLSLNESNGNLIWNAPGDAELGGVREYNVAFVMEEWRNILGKPTMLSYVVRDMQIIVEDTDNRRPGLEGPPDICVEAGTDVREMVQGTDTDGHPVMLEAYGGPFIISSPATFSPDPPVFQDSPGFGTFEWETECGHVRVTPYEVQFKVTDKPEIGPELVDFEPFLITVVGPAPTGLSTSAQPDKSINLSWDDYRCENADKMQIWRRVGSYDLDVDECQVGMPTNTGYELINTVAMNTTEYLDSNEGRGLAEGAKYCYRLVAIYEQNGGDAFSLVSEEVCESIAIDAPVITHVDIDVTDQTSGEIIVRWTRPYQINEDNYPPAYSYDLYRAEGGSTTYQPVVKGFSDTVYVDTGLNTQQKFYNYYVRCYDARGVLVDSSASASSVRLALRPHVASIEVNWSAEVPWTLSSQEYPYHYIYRDHAVGDPDQLVLIDSVDVSGQGFFYVDDGSFNEEPLNEDVEYCYFISTYGSYGNDLLPEPLINRSQTGCAQPNDTIPPCTPSNIVVNDAQECSDIISKTSCDISLYSNTLEWDALLDSACSDVVSYNIYFSSTGMEEDYELISSADTEKFVHVNLNSLKGCYRVASVDRSGNESSLSEPTCIDNCPVFIFPNVFTPNNDGKNDLFGPLTGVGQNNPSFPNTECPRFVNSVVFRVYDRAGSKIYEYDSYENRNGIFINWDGTTQRGRALPAGVYYYEAEVTYNVLNPQEANVHLTGWVQLLK